MRVMFRTTAFVLLLLLVSTSLTAQTVSGSIDGTVRDHSSGEPLPGVTVGVRSDALVSGTRVAVTDAGGRYRFPSLPPGIYSVEAALAGFQSARQNDVRVSIGQTISVNIPLMMATLSEEITIIAEAPRVDVTSSSTSSVLGEEYIERLPLSRNANALFNNTPGVNDSRAYGGTLDASNTYSLDGVNVSDPGAGGYWILPNVDWLKEVQVAGLGANAEYGGFTGAIFNMVTRSGGNELSGVLSAYYSNSDLSSTNSPDPGNADLSPFELDSDGDVSLSVGGALVRDRLWYFVSGQEVARKISPFGADQTTDTRLSRYLGKLSWQPDVRNSFVGLVDYDGKTQDRRGISNFVLESATVDQDSPNASYNLTWESIFNSSNFVSVKLTGFDGADDRLPRNGSTTPGRSDVDSGISWQNNAFTRYQDKSRNTLDASWSFFTPDRWIANSSHSMKFGAVIEQARHDESRTRNGGFTWVDDSWYCDSMGDYFTNPICGVYSSDRGNEINLRTKLQGINLYAQDAWKIGQLTLNYGLRYTDYQGGFDNTRDDAYSVEFIDPRIGGVWDVGGQGRTALRAHYGRYHEDLFVYLFDRDAEAGAFTPLEYWDYNFDTGEFDIPAGRRTNSALLDPAIDHPYMEQWVIGGDRQFGSNLRLGLDYIHREWREINAMVNVNGDYDALVAPNIPGVAPLPFHDLLSNPENVLTNPAGARRDYDAVQVRFDRRHTNGWMFSASVVWADLTGNAWASDGYVAEYRDLNGQTNADGRLPGFSEWEAKISGSYDIPGGFTVSGYYRYLSGEYWTPVVRIDGLYRNNRQFVFMQGRGSEQLDDRHNLDLRLSKRFGFGASAISAFVDVFNVGNENTVLSVDDWYGTYRYNYRNHPNGSTFSTRAAYGEPQSIEAPRQYRIGVKYSF
jgi:hypothetical protein